MFPADVEADLLILSSLPFAQAPKWHLVILQGIVYTGGIDTA